MDRTEILLPIRGLSDIFAADAQEPQTTRIGLNVSELCPLDLSIGISQRAGQVKHTSAALSAGTKVSKLDSIVYDNPSHTYTNLASAACTVEWEAPGANRSEAFNIVSDDFGNQFYVDGAAAIVKVNTSGRQVWRISLPAKEKNSIVRALAVDVDGRIYAAVSAGVYPEDAQMWCYDPIDENKPPELLWTLEPGWLTEELHVDGATLQASQNNPTTRFSRMALYSGLGQNAPTLIREWDIPYPVNGHHFSPKDGSIFTAHQPDDQRTHTPTSVDTTGSRQDWTPRDLDHYADRVRAWVDADDVDGGGLGNDSYAAGDTIDTIVDKTGNGRDLVAASGDVGGVLRKQGIAGRDTIFFNGTNNSYASSPGLSTDFQLREINRNFLPTHTKAQFALFMVVRLPQAQDVGRIVMAHGDGAKMRALLMNMGPATAGNVVLAGNLSLWETNQTSGTNSPLANTVLPGGYDNSGLCLITYIFDGGYDDVAGTPTRSTLRINGRPCDQWTSGAVMASLKSTYLGKAVDGTGTVVALSRMIGDFCEAIVLQDWYLPGYAQTSPLAQQKLITIPSYPNAVWSANGDSECERIEGYLAHKWGMAHKLPSGDFNILKATANYAAGETVTIGSQVYTWAAAAGAANTVVVGANGFLSSKNLHHAINKSGVEGTDYGTGTTANTSVWSPCVVSATEAFDYPGVLVQGREPRSTTHITTTETCANASWLAGAATVDARSNTNFNDGHYPHPFFLQKTAKSPGGPPRTQGVTFPSVTGALISQFGILAKWDPANGKPRNVLTTDGPGFGGLPFGGVGYGVRVASDGSVYTIGPRQAAVSALGISADPIDARKVWDKGAEDTTAGGWNVNNGTTSITSWTAQIGAQTYAYPRMDVDKWDNLYIPTYQASNGTTMVVIAKLGASASNPGADVLLTYADLTDDPRAYAISVDPDYPTYPNGFTKPRAERVLIGTERITGASNFNVLHMIRIVSATQSNLAVRAQKRVAACGAGLYDITTPASVTTIDAAAFSSTSPFIASCEAFGKLFFTDANTYKVYDPTTGVLSALRAQSAGELPKRGRLIARFVNRIFIGGFEDHPERVCASTAGNPYGWDFDPPGEAPLATAAYRSDLTTSGDFPDLVQCLLAWRDDLLYIFGARNVFVLRGDPLQGGRFDTVVKGTGAAFGRSACFTPDGRLWWITNEAELYSMPVGGGEGSAHNVATRISKRLQDAIDLSVCRPELVYDPRMRRINIYLFPLGAGDTLFRHFVVSLVDPRNPRFWEESYGHKNVQPTAAMLLSGDTGETRVMLYGSRDGYVRQWSASAKSDDGYRIDSQCQVDLMPQVPPGIEAMASNIDVLLARADGGARIELYVTDEPENLGDVFASASLLPGWNTPTDLRGSGAYVSAVLTGETGMDRWSVLRMIGDIEETGMVRSRR